MLWFPLSRHSTTASAAPKITKQKGTKKKAILKCSDILSVQLELQEIITGHFQQFLDKLFAEHFSSSILVQSWVVKFNAEICYHKEKSQMIINWQANLYWWNSYWITCTLHIDLQRTIAIKSTLSMYCISAFNNIVYFHTLNKIIRTYQENSSVKNLF